MKWATHNFGTQMYHQWILDTTIKYYFIYDVWFVLPTNPVQLLFAILRVTKKIVFTQHKLILEQICFRAYFGQRTCFITAAALYRRTNIRLSQKKIFKKIGLSIDKCD